MANLRLVLQALRREAAALDEAIAALNRYQQACDSLDAVMRDRCESEPPRSARILPFLERRAERDEPGSGQSRSV